MVLLGGIECVHFRGPSTAHVLEGKPSIINSNNSNKNWNGQTDGISISS